MEVNKAKLDVLIAMVREYWTNLDIKSAERRVERINKFVDEELSEKPHFKEFLFSILSGFGVKPGATNEDIYKVLEILGWEVK